MGQTTKAYQESFEDSKFFFEAFCVCRFRSKIEPKLGISFSSCEGLDSVS